MERQMRWSRIRAEIDMSYPLDQESAAAVEAAKQHHVLTWDVLEEGDDIGQWLVDHFVAEGKTALPDGAYLMKSGTKSSYMPVPTEDEVQDLFQDAERYQKFQTGEDYSYGLSDVTDAEYDQHYEAVMSAVREVLQPGTVVELPTLPHQFLKDAPLIDGSWIDRFIVQLAEWGARLAEKGFLLEESGDNHPMAWYRIINQDDGSEADAAATRILWQQTGKHLAGFPGRTKVIAERLYLNFEDYVKWKGRRNKGDLKSGIRTGLAVTSWNQWVEAQGGEGMASLAGVMVGKFHCYLDRYRYRVCRDAGELAEESTRRKSLLESLQIGNPGSNDGGEFRTRVEQWKESTLRFLPEIYTLRRAIDSINQRYFEGQETLFPESAEGLDRLIASLENLVGIYNEALAEDIEHLERLLNETGDWQNESPLTVDMAGLIESIQGAVKAQVAYMVDMAKSDALDVLGESRQAWELVDRYV